MIYRERQWPVDKRAASYYDMSLQIAIEIASDRILEWEFAHDPNGYCHERPVLVALLAAAERWRKFEDFADGMLRG